MQGYIDRADIGEKDSDVKRFVMTTQNVKEFANPYLDEKEKELVKPKYDVSSFEAGAGFLKTLRNVCGLLPNRRRFPKRLVASVQGDLGRGIRRMEVAGILLSAPDHRSIVLWSGVDDYAKGFAEAKDAYALARLPMDRVLTILTGLEAKRRANPDEEWEVQNWDEHTLRPWEAVSKSLVRWGEQAEKLTIYVVLKKFSTGAVFWNTEMKTLCKDFLEAREKSSEKVIMDVRLHAKFDDMQKEQRESGVSSPRLQQMRNSRWPERSMMFSSNVWTAPTRCGTKETAPRTGTRSR